MTKKRPWPVRLTAAAEQDYREILTFTMDRFGPRQARTYATTLTLALRALVDGPTVVGAKARDDIGAGVLTLHVARGRRAGRHFIVFRRAHDAPASIDALRILHDSMDLVRHLHDPVE